MVSRSAPGPLIVSFCWPTAIAPVVSVIVLVPQPGSLVVRPLMSIVSPDAAPSTAARRLPEPLSLQLMTAGGTAHAAQVDAANSAVALTASGLRCGWRSKHEARE